MNEAQLPVERLSVILGEVKEVRVSQKGPRRTRLDVAADALPALLELLKGRAGFVHLSAISCVDWPQDGEFELQLLVSAHTRIDREPGVYVSVYDIYHPAGFFERDIHEMYGVYFEGAPDMEKFILTEWDGPPPMRKEFDSEAWVNDHFDWQDYRPDWLIELEQQGGGVVIPPDEQRFSRRDLEEPGDEG